jgi:hypothetical protein
VAQPAYAAAPFLRLAQLLFPTSFQLKRASECAFARSSTFRISEFERNFLLNKKIN